MKTLMLLALLITLAIPTPTHAFTHQKDCIVAGGIAQVRGKLYTDGAFTRYTFQDPFTSLRLIYRNNGGKVTTIIRWNDQTVGRWDGSVDPNCGNVEEVRYINDKAWQMRLNEVDNEGHKG